MVMLQRGMVRELLVNRVRAGGAVHCVGGRVMRKQETQLVVNPWKGRIDDLRRHEIRENLFHPDVVEPLHRDEIAKPHMRCFMRNRCRTVQHLVFSRRFVQQDRGPFRSIRLLRSIGA